MTSDEIPWFFVPLFFELFVYQFQLNDLICQSLVKAKTLFCKWYKPVPQIFSSHVSEVAPTLCLICFCYSLVPVSDTVRLEQAEVCSSCRATFQTRRSPKS